MQTKLVGLGYLAGGVLLAACATGLSPDLTAGGAGAAGATSTVGTGGASTVTGTGAGGLSGTGTGPSHTGGAGGGTGGGGEGGAGGASTSQSSSSSSGSGGCSPGQTQSCYNGPGGTMGVGVCKGGVETCANGVWGPCVGEVVPSVEVCDGLDNDCNNVVDEGCAPVSFQNLIDFDAAGDKTLFAIGGTGAAIIGKCWKGDGSVLRDTFTVVNDIYMGGGSGNGPEVVVARGAGRSLVTWCSEANGFNNRVFRSQLFDASCMPLGVPFTWPGAPAGEYDYDTAIDAQGNFALVWKDPLSPSGATLHVSFYDANGVPVVANLVAGTCDASGSGYAMHVALNQVTGAGLVSCQGHQFNTIRYRRFDASHAWVDAGMVDLAGSTSNHSSWYESHAIGMNDSGEFAIEWEDATAKQFKASFFSAAGALQSTVSLGPTDANFYFDAFRYPHQAVQLDGGDFLFRDDPWNNQMATFWRYTSAGVFVGCGKSAHKKYSLRTGSGASLFMAEGDTILPSALDVSNAVCP